MKPKLLLCLALVLSGGLNCPAAIIYPKAPDGGQQVIRETFTGAVPQHLPLPRRLSNRRFDHRQSLPGLFRRADESGFRSIAPGGPGGYLAVFLTHGTNAVGAAELMIDPTNSPTLRFAGLDTVTFPRKRSRRCGGRNIAANPKTGL